MLQLILRFSIQKEQTGATLATFFRDNINLIAESRQDVELLGTNGGCRQKEIWNDTKSKKQQTQITIKKNPIKNPKTKQHTNKQTDKQTNNTL